MRMEPMKKPMSRNMIQMIALNMLKMSVLFDLPLGEVPEWHFEVNVELSIVWDPSPHLN